MLALLNDARSSDTQRSKERFMPKPSMVAQPGRSIRKAAAPPPRATPPNDLLTSSGPLPERIFSDLYKSEPLERVTLVKQGLPPTAVEEIAKRMRVSKEKLFETLGLPRATIERKVRESRTLSPDESSRVIGLMRLIGQVQTIVEESGDPTGFDAARWTADWLERRVPALAGRRPSEYMDTWEGQQLVSGLVMLMQTGAYA